MGLEEIRRLKFEASLPKPKKVYSLKKVSDKRAAKEKEAKEAGTDSGMDKFFKSQRKRMTGKCLFCGGSTNKNDDEKFHFSIAHLLPKRPVDKGGFPSVATNTENWIELCFWDNSCHARFDQGKITWEFLRDSKEWDIIAEKLHEVLPLVADEERKNKLYSRLTELLYEKTTKK